jgi:hypothetical protein
MAIVSARLAPRTVLAWTAVALYVAVMARHDITELMGLARGFDAYPGINRLA